MFDAFIKVIPNFYSCKANSLTSLTKVVNKHAPLQPLIKCKAKQFSKPWITREIHTCKSIKVKMLCLHLEIMKNINIIAINYLHSFDAVRSRTIIHISMII